MDNKLSDCDVDFLNFITEDSSDLIIVISDDNTVIGLNDSALSFFSQNKEKTKNKDYEYLCDLLKLPIQFKKFLGSKEKIAFQDYLWSNAVFRTKNNQCYHVISGKINSKNSLQHENFLLKSIIASIPGSIYWKDINGKYLGCNDFMVKVAGFSSKNDIIGKTDLELWPNQAHTFTKTDQEVMTLKCAQSVEERVDLPNGRTRFFTVEKTPLFDNEGNVIGILGNSLEITELKETQEKLEKAKIAAEAGEKAKTEFIANMSHDIRTPLSGVVGLGEIIEKEVENPKHQKMVHDMVGSSYALLDMLNSILDVISLENITVDDIHEEPFDLPHLVQAIVDLEKSSVDLKKIELLSSIDKQIPTVLFGDHKKVYHIVLNLVGNAIKFTKQGHVDINIKLLEKNNDRAQLLFEITDTGMGISSENIGKVFDLFYKVTPSHKGLDQRHGIGLHIVKTYTELLGGKIAVESKLNEGSKFSFILTFKIPDKDAIPVNITQASLEELSKEPPIITNAQALPTTESLVTDVEPNAPKILIIEDNDVVRMVAEDMVRTTIHCNSTTASDGETGLELAKNQPFDLILSDIGLPGISGIEFAKQLRQYEKDNNKKPTPIVAVTGHVQTIQKDCLEAGINQVIIKPMKPEILTSLCTEFALFNEKQEPSPPFNKPSLQSATQKQGALGPDLPNTEAELFAIDNLPIFDMENAQRILGNNTTLLMKVLKDSINITIPEEFPRIKKAHEAGDWVKVADIVHKLKGGFLSVSLTRLGVACQYLERYHQAGHTAALERLYQQFIKILDITTQQLKPWTE